MDDDGLGGGFWLKLIGVIFLIGIGGLIAFLIIGWAWYAWGFIGAFLFVAVVLAIVAWFMDRSRAKRYAEADAEYAEAERTRPEPLS